MNNTDNTGTKFKNAEMQGQLLTEYGALRAEIMRRISTKRKADTNLGGTYFVRQSFLQVAS